MPHDPWYVLKFGGSTVGAPDRLVRALDIVQRQRTQGQVAVVVSALGDTTERLLDVVQRVAAGDVDGALAHVRALQHEALEVIAQTAVLLDVPPVTDAGPLTDALLAPLFDTLRGAAAARLQEPALSDFIVAHGELLSAHLLTRLFTHAGLDAVVVDARAWTLTDAAFGQAKPVLPESYDRLRALAATWQGRLPVVTGFVGRTADGRTTTLGRNGSDYTAALVAGALHAVEVSVWTDVSGVMTADPALVHDAYPVPHLSLREAFDLAHMGLRMFHPRAMLTLLEQRIPLRIRDSAHPDDAGTRIDAVGPANLDRPASVVSWDGLGLIDLGFDVDAGAHHMGERVLQVLDREQVALRMSVQAPAGRAMSVLVPQRDVARATAALRKELSAELADGSVEQLNVREPVTQVTLIAEAMGRGPNVAGQLFAAVGAVGISVHAIAQGGANRSIAFVVDDSDTALAVRTVHAALNFAHVEVSLFLLGKGVVGTSLLDQIRAQSHTLLHQHGISLRLVGLADSQRVLFDPEGIALDAWQTLLGAQPPQTVDVLQVLDRLRRLPMPLLVDCTALDGMEQVYQQAFARGIHVVGANKKPLVVPLPEWDQLRASSRRHYRHYFHETTVGASLPVVGTLEDLVRTGDRVRLIEGSFSGTLGYLANALMAGQKLSDAVLDAKRRGYTEPHPRDDLSGIDAGRKALILAREVGLRLEMTDVAVEPFVPAGILEHDDLDAFFAALRSVDDEVEARIAGYRAEGKVLRYLARIDPQAPSGKVVQVGPVAVDLQHPASRLRGSEAFVAFSTERYAEYPLIVQGAGAGGPVTAAGVLADVLKIAQSVRGG